MDRNVKFRRHREHRHDFIGIDDFRLAVAFAGRQNLFGFINQFRRRRTSLEWNHGQLRIDEALRLEVFITQQVPRLPRFARADVCNAFRLLEIRARCAIRLREITVVDVALRAVRHHDQKFRARNAMHGVGEEFEIVGGDDRMDFHGADIMQREIRIEGQRLLRLGIAGDQQAKLRIGRSGGADGIWIHEARIHDR